MIYGLLFSLYSACFHWMPVIYVFAHGGTAITIYLFSEDIHTCLHTRLRCHGTMLYTCYILQIILKQF